MTSGKSKNDMYVHVDNFVDLVDFFEILDKKMTFDSKSVKIKLAGMVAKILVQSIML